MGTRILNSRGTESFAESHKPKAAVLSLVVVPHPAPPAPVVDFCSQFHPLFVFLQEMFHHSHQSIAAREACLP